MPRVRPARRLSPGPDFPWEDWRESQPGIIERDIFSELSRWAAESGQPGTMRALSRKDRVRLYFGTEGAHWDEERVLDRYELLYEAGLIEKRDATDAPRRWRASRFRNSAHRCASTTAESWPRESPGCAPN